MEIREQQGKLRQGYIKILESYFAEGLGEGAAKDIADELLDEAVSWGAVLTVTHVDWTGRNFPHTSLALVSDIVEDK